MKLHLEDQVVIVTGGAKGIGLATAKLFLSEQARVFVWDKQELSFSDDSEIKQALAEGRLAYCSVDVTKDDSLQLARETTLAELGRIDHWVHAAAIGSGKFGFPFTQLSPDDWHRVLDINIMGMVRTAHCLTPTFQKQRSGTMTMIGSVAGQIGSQTDPPYSASKAANINFTHCMAKDLASYNVRVNIVHPGMVKTDLNRSVWRSWHDRQPMDQRQSYEDWAAAKIKQLTPLGRWQTPEDVANLIVFLSSSRANNITGQSINVDGGWVIRW
jgi:2-hydroxycyclohexanecarboxyl-CoA dehydrogenase